MDIQRLMGVIAGGVGGMLLGGPIGAAAGAGLGYFTPEIGSGAKKVLGNPVGGTIAGGTIGGIAGFALFGPLGALAGATLGGTVGGSIGTMIYAQDMQQQQQQAMMQMYQGYPYGSYGQGLGMGTMGTSGYPSSNAYGMNDMYGMGFGQAYGSYSQNAYNSAGVYGYLGTSQYGQQYQQTSSYTGITKKLENGSVEYQSRGGYKVNMNGSTVTITDPDGSKTTKIWGDPHVKEADGSNWDWSSKTATFLLPDGTKVTMNAESADGVVKSTNIYDGGNLLKVDNSKMTYESQYDPQKAYLQDIQEADGKTYATQNKGDDWTEIYNQEKAGDPITPTTGTDSSGKIDMSKIMSILPLLMMVSPALAITFLLGILLGNQAGNTNS